jgi:hypothetical protein
MMLEQCLDLKVGINYEYVTVKQISNMLDKIIVKLKENLRETNMTEHDDFAMQDYQDRDVNQ